MRRWRAAAAACLIAVVCAACSSGTRHRVLEFFFDGVPRAGAASVAANGFTAPSGAASGAAVDYEHGPYAAKMCDGCHETGKANALVAPRDALCSRCHSITLGKRFVHGPLLAGGCLLCHDPHRSRYPFLLVADSTVFCARCHDPGSLRPVEGHEATGPSCTACHDAHMSDRRFLLR